MFVVRTLPDGLKSFKNLVDYRSHYWASNTAEAFERARRLEDPRFRSFGPSGHPRPGDDLRLLPDNPAGVSLPVTLLLMDLRVRDILHLGTRDRGCCRFSSDRLRVGVDGLWEFPPS
jgi:hypothetical protein